MASLHFLDQVGQNEVQNDILVMWCHWFEFERLAILTYLCMVYACMHLSMHIGRHFWVNAYVCIYGCRYLCIYVCMYVFKQILCITYMHAYTDVYILIMWCHRQLYGITWCYSIINGTIAFPLSRQSKWGATWFFGHVMQLCTGVRII